MVTQTMGVYVDGFNLYHGLHDKFGRRMLWLDLVALAQSLRPTYRLEHLHYFTAPVLNDPSAASRQGIYQEALKAASPGVVQITQGLPDETLRCRKCGNEYRSYEEKETDVSIAANIVADAARARFDAALIISADSDLIPAIKQPETCNLPFSQSLPSRRRGTRTNSSGTCRPPSTSEPPRSGPFNYPLPSPTQTAGSTRDLKKWTQVPPPN